ncbi:hypothetical protein RchiOBHm_Chr3g0450551 [Rosa chinensis]|uniref:Uncharacterized protein n=1 Tax=Rosa chinensis TaxID=74649 RepID=A0A2P6R5U0_ROSCH|nr:hypothetical protein RchiOBHm_Chr3g0450551 [Rosa chinensis]
MMTVRRLHGFFFSSSLCLKMQKLKTREWREKWKGNGETKKMRWMKELENGEEMVRQGDEMDEGMCFRMRGEGVYIGKKKKSEMMSGRKIMKVEYESDL